MVFLCTQFRLKAASRKWRLIFVILYTYLWAAYTVSYRCHGVPDDIDGRPDERSDEADEEVELRVKEVVPPGALEVAEVVAHDADVHKAWNILNS